MIPPFDEVIEKIIGLYEKYGHEDYIGEPVSQLEHMSQSAELAMKQGYDDEVVLAAFFHDIGHLCVPVEPDNNMGGFGIRSHEKIGANFLRSNGFPEKIASLVEKHVQAKRYLTYKYPAYYFNLSDASKKTLEFQGGKMNKNEAIQFEADPLFAISLLMRQWDEMAKEVSKPVIDLNTVKEKMKAVLLNQ